MSKCLQLLPLPKLGNRLSYLLLPFDQPLQFTNMAAARLLQTHVQYKHAILFAPAVFSILLQLCYPILFKADRKFKFSCGWLLQQIVNQCVVRN